MKIAIIGYGRFGKLLSGILAPYGEIFISEKKPIRDKSINLIQQKELILMDWVILAVPISELEKILEDIKPHLKKGCLVMDVSSVKVHPCRWLKRHLPRQVEILGTHPMFGPDSAKDGLEGLKIVVCPVRISSNKLKELTRIFKDMKLEVIRTTPKKHDQEAAKSLSLVHFLGRALGMMKIGKQNITTLGYERLLLVNETVNNDSWQLFLDMHRYNPYARKIRRKFLEEAGKIDRKIIRLK